MALGDVSLLWPAGRRGAAGGAPGVSAAAATDLDLDPVVRALAGRDSRREAMVRAVLTRPVADGEVIRYRQAALTDLMNDARLRAGLGSLLSLLAEAAHEEQPAARGESDWGVLAFTRRLNDLALYVRAVERLQALLAAAAPASEAFGALRAAVEEEAASESFRALQAELPAVRSQLSQGECITLVINLKPSWEPESAAILSIGPRTAGRGILQRLLPGQAAHALTPLRRVEGAGLLAADHSLGRDLRALLESTAAPVIGALERFHQVHAAGLMHLEAELAFLLGAAELFARLGAMGLPFCMAEVAPIAERSARIESAFSLALALRLLADPRPGPRRIVPSDVRFSPEGRIWILTGPNRGGKTTFLRAVGLSHLLFATGLPVPGRRARLSPIDRIITHFVTQEHGTPGEGRLDEEAEGLAQIFAEATPHSLILLNEVLAGSTSQVEALALAGDAVRGLRLLGARCVFATHLHDLAASVDRINASVPDADSAVGSLVAGVLEPGDTAPEPITFGRTAEAVAAPGTEPPAGAERGEGEPQPTFHIMPGPPRGLSFASAIARQHGISFAQLRDRLRARGIGVSVGQEGREAVPAPAPR